MRTDSVRHSILHPTHTAPDPSARIHRTHNPLRSLCMKSPALRHIATASIIPLLVAGCNHSTPQSTSTNAGQPTPNRVSGYVYPAEELRRRTVSRRALEAVIWGMPVVNFDR